MNKHESMCETYKHKQEVNKLMAEIASYIVSRGIYHDNSKLEEPEASVFATYTEKLKDCTYGSEEYKQYLKGMKPALENHYRINAHHPEGHINGIKDMTLIDLVEMICDWKAATLRHADGDIIRSIELNQKRFGYGDELKQIFLNTVEQYFTK